MSGRFVRASKFRHVHGEPPKSASCFSELRMQTSGESNYIAASKSFFAVALQGGGGPMIVHPLDKPQRFPASFPHVNVHRAKVLDMDFSPFNPGMVASSSDDGTVKIVIIPEGGLVENLREPVVDLTGHQKRVGLCTFNPTAENILASASYDNTVRVWDIEAQAEQLCFTGHSEFVQCAEWNSNGSSMATTSKDKKIRLYDPRNPDAVTVVDGHRGARSSRIAWMENHNLLAVCGFSKQSVRSIWLFDPRNMEEKAYELELDQSAGVMMTHYDVDTSMLWVAGKGDGNIRYYEIVDESPFIHHLSDFRSNVPQKGCAFAPKSACDYMSCEVQLILRLQKNVVEPIHFKVPRKSELFQDDLYPPTSAGKPSVSAADWLGGANGDVILCSIQEAAEGGNVKAFVAKKSPAELEKELADALARIAELEAELAQLKA